MFKSKFFKSSSFTSLSSRLFKIPKRPLGNISSNSSNSPSHSSLFLSSLTTSLLVSSLVLAQEEKQATEKQSTQSTDYNPSEMRYTSPLNLLAPLKDIKKENLSITIYQYEACPFCTKVRTFLDFHKIPYTLVEVNPLSKSQIRFSKSYKKVPIVMVNNIQINDSSLIITELSQLLGFESTESLSSQSIYSWRHWVDNKLVHTLPPNIYRSSKEAQQAFEYISEMQQFSYLQTLAAKWGGSTVMNLVSKKLKKKYGIEDERQALYDCANTWMTGLAGRNFMGGDQVSLADLATYGALSSIEGLEAYHVMRKNTRIGEWYDRMKVAVGKTSRLNNFRKASDQSIMIK